MESDGRGPEQPLPESFGKALAFLVRAGVLVLFLFVFVFSPASIGLAFETFFSLAAGWIRFIVETLRAVDVVPSHVLYGFGVLLCLGAGVHWLGSRALSASGCHGRRGWTWRFTLVAVAAPILLYLSAIGSVGFTHAMVRLFELPRVTQWWWSGRGFSNVREISQEIRRAYPSLPGARSGVAWPMESTIVIDGDELEWRGAGKVILGPGPRFVIVFDTSLAREGHALIARQGSDGAGSWQCQIYSPATDGSYLPDGCERSPTPLWSPNP